MKTSLKGAPSTARFLAGLILAWVVLAIALVPRVGAAPPATVSPQASLDNSLLRVGLCRQTDIPTFRMQAFKGIWTLILRRNTVASGATLAQESNYVIYEGEWVSFMGSARGFFCKLSTGEELMDGYDQATLRGGELMAVEPPNREASLYRGELEVGKFDSFLELTNLVTVRDFLRSHVSEVTPSSEVAAIQAQAVIARTAVQALRQRHASQSFNLCDQPHCLVYSGANTERDLVALLIDSVPNQTLTWQGQHFLPYWHHTCGGRISTAAELLGTPDPVHQGKIDRWDSKGNVNCFHSPSFNWQIEVDRSDMQNMLDVAFAGGASNVIRGWQVERRDGQGRIAAIRVLGRIIKHYPGSEFLARLTEFFGPHAFKSLWFEEVAMQRSVLIKGHGRGHGMGLCQMGADGLARRGIDYRKILAFYFPSTQLQGSTADKTEPTPGERPRRRAGR